MRFLLGRKTGGDAKGTGRRGEGEQGDLPEWAKGWLPKQLVPFLCGSVAGVTSWALIYPVDVSDLGLWTKDNSARKNSRSPAHSPDDLPRSDGAVLKEQDQLSEGGMTC